MGEIFSELEDSNIGPCCADGFPTLLGSWMDVCASLYLELKKWANSSREEDRGICRVHEGLGHVLGRRKMRMF